MCERFSRLFDRFLANIDISTVLCREILKKMYFWIFENVCVWIFDDLGGFRIVSVLVFINIVLSEDKYWEEMRWFQYFASRGLIFLNILLHIHDGYIWWRKVLKDWLVSKKIILHWILCIKIFFWNLQLNFQTTTYFEID